MKHARRMVGIAAFQRGVASLAAVGTMIMAPQAWAQTNPYEEALALAEDGRYLAALDPLQIAAEAGDVRAQRMLGQWLYYGGALATGIPRDLSAAQKWLRRAADQEDPVARHYLTVMAAGRPAQSTSLSAHAESVSTGQ